LKLVLDTSAAAKWFIVEEESGEMRKLRELQVLWRESRIFYFRSGIFSWENLSSSNVTGWTHAYVACLYLASASI